MKILHRDARVSLENRSTANRKRNNMLDLCLLGTGGMMPLPYRWLTSLMLRYNGSSLLIDCGDGTADNDRTEGT